MRTNVKWLLMGALATLLLLWPPQPAGSVVGPRTGPPPAPPEHVVRIELDGLACGAHLEVSPRHLFVERGSWVTIVNDTPWAHTIRVVSGDGGSEETVALSERIEPGETWRTRLTRKGSFTLLSENKWHVLAGLKGEVTVQ